MRYSTRTRYGLRFLINLAGRPAGSCVQLAEIAREEGVSVKYLEQIVRVLRLRAFCVPHAGPREAMRLRNPRTSFVWMKCLSIWEGTSLRWNVCTGQKTVNGKALAPRGVLAGAG